MLQAQDISHTVGTVVVLAWLLLLYLWLHSHVKLVHGPETVQVPVWDKERKRVSSVSLAQLVRLNCASLSARFLPTPYLPNGHFQTIFSGLTGRLGKKDVAYDRELLSLPDSGVLAIDWINSAGAGAPILIIVHGISGSSTDGYILDLIPEAVAKGFRLAVLNLRGCGGVAITTPQLYSASNTEDVRKAIEYIHTKNPGVALIGIGFSLGANILMKCVGEDSCKSLLLASISVANPYDLNVGSVMLHSTWIGREFYSRLMTFSLVALFKRHEKMFASPADSPREPIRLAAVLKSKYIADYDESVTRRNYGFRNTSEYYRMGSCAQYIPDIAIPTLFLSDLNDPIVAPSVIPCADVLSNPNIILATTRNGGHIGWYEGLLFPTRWYPKPVLEFSNTIVKAFESLPHHERHHFKIRHSTKCSSAIYPLKKKHVTFEKEHSRLDSAESSCAPEKAGKAQKEQSWLEAYAGNSSATDAPDRATTTYEYVGYAAGFVIALMAVKKSLVGRAK
ncbi:hypothetical protein CcCBS67573_g02544 [Chytriomyces confervae]|uniref:AB hydrolase-1 domain-containing protein n=1 Tax=Chytriomyces confervae TaxID=246404 RepID=A0A507FLH9_9FUNG|nr:hypothetical protein CcCBS67573_g02544 [Chytriomyces confervae]